MTQPANLDKQIDEILNDIQFSKTVHSSGTITIGYVTIENRVNAKAAIKQLLVAAQIDKLQNLKWSDTHIEHLAALQSQLTDSDQENNKQPYSANDASSGVSSDSHISTSSEESLWTEIEAAVMNGYSAMGDDVDNVPILVVEKVLAVFQTELARYRQELLAALPENMLLDMSFYRTNDKIIRDTCYTEGYNTAITEMEKLLGGNNG